MAPAGGGPGVAFRQLVLKVHSRCNLACDYCYVYEAADTSWRVKPKAVDRRTVRAVGERVAEHAAAHDVPTFRITLHGGEPLLVGHERMRELLGDLHAAVAGRTRLDIGIQTNGVLLDEQFVQLFLEQRVRVGISLDGGRAANDRHRLYRRGASSYDEVVRAVDRMTRPDARPLFAGLLATVDPDNDPVELYRDLAALAPGRIDLLLPHATHDHPPPGARSGGTVYGDWLVGFFDVWYREDRGMAVRLFDEILHALLGGASISEAVGLSAPESIVVETDGTVERTDALKVAYDRAPATGYSVHEHSLDDVLRHPAVAAGMAGLAALSATCRACPIVSACGGGLFPHRFRSGTGFDNPSVYCRDLGRLITWVADRVAADLSALRETLTAGAPADPGS